MRSFNQGLLTYPDPPSFWYRYVDDTLTSLKTSEKIDFLNHLNRPNPSIPFSMEPEKDGAIAGCDIYILFPFCSNLLKFYLQNEQIIIIKENKSENNDLNSCKWNVST